VGPYRLYGPVVSGFKRGSKLLGFPTANLSPESFGSTMKSAPRGVYAGWAQINDGPVLKTAISLGYNPTFNNQQETVEAYILHQFPHDFLWPKSQTHYLRLHQTSTRFYYYRNPYKCD